MTPDHSRNILGMAQACQAFVHVIPAEHGPGRDRPAVGGLQVGDPEFLEDCGTHYHLIAGV